MAGSNDSNARELTRVVAINEETRRVVAIAFEINISALNAMLVALRAGEAALGFNVVSKEMRVFAASLKGCMEDISRTTFDTLTAVTSLLRVSRSIAVHHRAAANERTRELLAPVIEAKAAHLEEGRAALEKNGAALAVQLEDARRLCQLGTVLSRSAKVEAAYGGTFGSSLTQVSGEFETSIAQIVESLRQIRGQAEDAHP